MLNEKHLDKMIFEALVPRSMEAAEAKLTPSLARLGFHPVGVERRRSLAYKNNGLMGKAAFHRTPEGFQLRFHIPTIVSKAFPEGMLSDQGAIDGDIEHIISILGDNEGGMTQAIAHGAQQMSVFNFRTILPELINRTVGPIIDQIKSIRGANFSESTKFEDSDESPREATYHFSMRPLFEADLIADIEPGYVNKIELQLLILGNPYGAMQEGTPFEGEDFEDLWNSLGSFQSQLKSIPMSDDLPDKISAALDRRARRRRPPKPRRRFG